MKNKKIKLIFYICKITNNYILFIKDEPISINDSNSVMKANLNYIKHKLEQDSTSLSGLLGQELK